MFKYIIIVDQALGYKNRIYHFFYICGFYKYIRNYFFCNNIFLK